MKFQLHPVLHALSAAIVLTLAACGSSSSPDHSASDTGTAINSTITRTGAVMTGQAIRKASLTYDLPKVTAAQMGVMAPMPPGAIADASTTLVCVKLKRLNSSSLGSFP